MGRFSILFLTIWAYLQVFPLEAKVYSDRLNKTDVRQVVTDVAAWQIKAYPDMDKDRYWKSNGDLSWENGVFLSALASWSEFDQNKEFIEFASETDINCQVMPIAYILQMIWLLP